MCINWHFQFYHCHFIFFLDKQIELKVMGKIHGGYFGMLNDV